MGFAEYHSLHKLEISSIKSNGSLSRKRLYPLDPSSNTDCGCLVGEFVCVWPFEVKAPFSGITSLSSQGKGVEPVIFRQVKKWSETLPNRFNLFSVNINWQGSNLNGFAFN